MADLRKDSNEGGFTLVELLVVVVIIGILVAIAFPVYNNIVSHANRVTVEANLRTIESAVTQFSANNEGTVPLRNDLAIYLM